MHQLPLVTIGAINYNNGRFVVETLDSIKSQTYPNIELIIVDDCSTDNGAHLIKEWLKGYGKPYKFIEHPKNEGVFAGCRDIYAAAKGKYLSLIATDDVLMPDKTEDQVNILERLGEEFGMVYGDALIIDEQSELLTHIGWKPVPWQDKDFIPPSGDIFPKIVKDIYFYLQSALVNLNHLQKIGFKYEQEVIADDYDVELAISRHYKVHGSKKVYFKYRRVEASYTSTITNPRKIHILYRSLFTCS